MRKLVALILAAIPARALAQTATTGTSGMPVLEKLTLGDAVNRAMQRNPTVETANEELSRAKALLEEARAGSLPTVTANGVYTRLDHERTLASAQPSPPATPAPARVIAGQDSESANVTLAVPLFAPGRWRNWAHAEDNVLAQGASTAEVKRQIALATGRAWLALAADERILQVDERARSDAQAHADYAAKRFGGGLGNRVDVVRAQQSVAQAVSLMEGARTSVVKAQEALGVLLGSDVPVDAEGASVPEPPDLESALRDATEKRSDVAAFRIREKVARGIANDAWTDYVPFVSAQFAPFYQNPPSLTQPKTGWQAQLLLTWSIYDGGLRYGTEREHRVLAREAKLAFEGTVREAKSEVRGWYEAITHADASLAAAREAAKLAHEQLDLANLAYQAGATTDLEVIDAERTALDADTQVAIAEDTARQARLELLGASGHFP